jgi:uncharacterized protein (DUF697 family)
VSPADEQDARGERLLTAVERLVNGYDSLIAEVEALSAEAFPGREPSDVARRSVVARELIARYSNKSAMAGGVAAAPAIVPGGGTLIAMTGGSLADMTLVLKFEVELALCLTHLYGHDIRDERERWLAYLLATVTTYEAKSGRNYFADVLDVQLEALRKYTPRQLSKLLVSALGKIAVLRMSRGLLGRALPLVGIGISAAANKVLTTTVGWRCVESLERRRTMPDDEEPVVDAKVK